MTTETTDPAPASTPARGPAAGRLFTAGVTVAVVLGAVVRFAYIWLDRRDAGVFADAFYYHEGANLLVDGRGFIHPFAAEDGVVVESADHPPVYMLYLAAWSLVGARTITWHLLANALLGLGSIVVAAYVGRRVGGDRVGVVAAVTVALYPNVWRHDGMLMSESATILAVLVTVLLAYRFWDQRTPARLLALAASVGVGALIRPEVLLLAPMLVLPFVLLVRERSWGWRLGWLGASAGVVLAVLAPWLVYNNLRFDDPVLISRNLGGTLAVSYCDSVFSGPRIGHWDYACGADALTAEGMDGYDPRADAVMRDAGLEYLTDNLDQLPVVVLARLGRITGLYRPDQQRDLDVFWGEAPRFPATAGMVTLPFVLVGATAGVVVLRRRRVPVLPLVAPVACVVVTVVVFYAATRFRATAEGPLSVLFAVGVVAGWDLLRRRNRPDAATSAHDRRAPSPSAAGLPSGAESSTGSGPGVPRTPQ